MFTLSTISVLIYCILSMYIILKFQLPSIDGRSGVCYGWQHKEAGSNSQAIQVGIHIVPGSFHKCMYIDTHTNLNDTKHCYIFVLLSRSDNCINLEQYNSLPLLHAFSFAMTSKILWIKIVMFMPWNQQRCHIFSKGM